MRSFSVVCMFEWIQNYSFIKIVLVALKRAIFSLLLMLKFLHICNTFQMKNPYKHFMTTFGVIFFHLFSDFELFFFLCYDVCSLDERPSRTDADLKVVSPFLYVSIVIPTTDAITIAGQNLLFDFVVCKYFRLFLENYSIVFFSKSLKMLIAFSNESKYKLELSRNAQTSKKHCQRSQCPFLLRQKVYSALTRYILHFTFDSRCVSIVQRKVN